MTLDYMAYKIGPETNKLFSAVSWSQNAVPNHSVVYNYSEVYCTKNVNKNVLLGKENKTKKIMHLFYGVLNRVIYYAETLLRIVLLIRP